MAKKKQQQRRSGPVRSEAFRYQVKPGHPEYEGLVAQLMDGNPNGGLGGSAVNGTIYTDSALKALFGLDHRKVARWGGGAPTSSLPAGAGSQASSGRPPAGPGTGGTRPPLGEEPEKSAGRLEREARWAKRQKQRERKQDKRLARWEGGGKNNTNPRMQDNIQRANKNKGGKGGGRNGGGLGIKNWGGPKNEKDANKAASDFFDASADQMGESWDNPGVSDSTMNWEGKEDFKNALTGHKLSTAMSNSAVKKPEGATLRKW